MSDSEHEVSWDYDTCCWEGCGEFATHRMYIGEEVVAHFCAEHVNAKANALDELEFDLEDVL